MKNKSLQQLGTQGQSTCLTELPAWQTLQAHFETIRHLHLRQLFADDPGRGERLTVEAAGLYLDYSKNRVTDETLQLLVGLAEACGLRERIDAMFNGEPINITEERAVLHTALRNRALCRLDHLQALEVGEAAFRKLSIDRVVVDDQDLDRPLGEGGDGGETGLGGGTDEVLVEAREALLKGAGGADEDDGLIEA